MWTRCRPIYTLGSHQPENLKMHDIFLPIARGPYKRGACGIYATLATWLIQPCMIDCVIDMHCHMS